MISGLCVILVVSHRNKGGQAKGTRSYARSDFSIDFYRLAGGVTIAADTG